MSKISRNFKYKNKILKKSSFSINRIRIKPKKLLLNKTIQSRKDYLKRDQIG